MSISFKSVLFQHTAARRRLANVLTNAIIRDVFQHTAARRRLVYALVITRIYTKFQHTAARRRLVKATSNSREAIQVSTHSRPKAAGGIRQPKWLTYNVSTHSRPKAAGLYAFFICEYLRVSTHSRPKAAGWSVVCNLCRGKRFNTQPPEGGWQNSTI